MEEQKYNCFVYVVITSCRKYVKVGRTRDIPNRLHKLKSGLFADVALMASHGFMASEHCSLFEKYLHCKYKTHKSRHHVSNEWFDASALDEILREQFNEQAVMNWMVKNSPGFAKRISSWIDYKTKKTKFILVKPFK